MVRAGNIFSQTIPFVLFCVYSFFMLNTSFAHFITARNDRFCQTTVANFRAREKKKDETTNTITLEIYELNKENKYEISTNVDKIIYQVYPFEENEEKKLVFVEGNYVYNDSTTN